MMQILPIRRLAPLLLLILATLGWTGSAHAQDTIPTVDVERRVYKAFDDGDYAAAARVIESYIDKGGNDPGMHYNLACAYSRLEALEKAAAALRRAVEAGFLEFDHMRADPDLENLRGHPMYEAILEAASRVRSRTALDRWKARFGTSSYRYEEDPGLNIAYATALDPTSHREMRDMLDREAEYLLATFFREPPEDQVLIAIPTPQDAARLFNGDDAIGGIYEHARRRLISRDIGGSLRHEFVHLMHYGHMERLNQAHPIWVQEGIACLFEDYEWQGTDIRFLPNDRQPITKNLVRAGRTVRWDKLMSMPARQFMGSRRGAHYAMVRSIFHFLADTGNLATWYAAYTKRFEEDRTGVRAFEDVFGAPIRDIENQWKTWVREQPVLDTRVRLGDAALGIEAEIRGENDGVRIQRVQPGSSAARAGLRRGDVIVSIDDRAVRSYQELQTLIAGKSVGDVVSVRYRRLDAYETTRIRLGRLTR